MDNQKIIMILLLITILLSIGSIIFTLVSNNARDLVPAGTNTVTTIDDDSTGTVGVDILTPPAGGGA